MDPDHRDVVLRRTNDPRDRLARSRIRDQLASERVRLLALKQKYDPQNLFRLNQNIT